MTDRPAAEVMCCPNGCVKNVVPRLRGECHASGFEINVRSLHSAGFMIVPRKPTAAMVTAAISRPEYGASTTLFYGDIYAAMTTEGELK